MNRLNYEKKHRFSFRKTTLGLASVVLFAFFMANPSASLAEEGIPAESGIIKEHISLNLHHALESELTSEEKALITYELPKHLENHSTDYLLVYRPESKEAVAKILPKTGGLAQRYELSGGLLVLLVVGGVALRRRKKIVPILLIVGVGSFVLSSSAIALSESVLSQYDRVYELSAGEVDIKPLELKGYRYIGYINQNVKPPIVTGGQKNEVISEKAEDTNEVKKEASTSSTAYIKAINTSHNIGTSESTPSEKVVEKVPTENVPVYEDERPSLELVEESLTETTTLPFKRVYETNPELADGEERVKQVGVNGTETIHYRITKANGEEVKREVINTERTEPVAEIVERGNFQEKVPTENVPVYEDDRPSLELVEESLTETSTLPFTRVYETNPELSDGEERVKQVGVNGTETIHYRITKANGEEVKREVVSTERTEPVAEIIERGTFQEKVPTENVPVYEDDRPTAVIEEEEVTEREVLPFETIYEDAADLAEGEERVKTEGVDGVTETTYRIIKVDGEIATREQVAQTTTPAVAKVIERGQGRLEKPTVEIASLLTHPESKSIEVTYTKTDNSKVLLSAKAKVYKGSELVKEVPIPDFTTPLEITGLDLYTDYTLKTEITYRAQTGEVTSMEESTRDFTLELKKIEFKDVDSIELYEKVGDSFKRVLYLESLPADTSSYMVKIKSDKNKEAWVPVHSFKESQKDGQATYEVKLLFDELVQERSGRYENDHIFHVARGEKEAGVYHSFKALLDAMRNSPTGRFVLGADMTADEASLSASDKAYLQGDFQGELIGEHGGKKFAIYNLAMPLFESLSSAKVTSLDLKDVAIKTAQGRVGALAKVITNSFIKDVAIGGNLEADSHIGGFASEASGTTRFENVSFEGTIRSTLTNSDASNLGGIVGTLTNNAAISSAKVDADIYFNHRSNNQRAGGLAGMATSGASITNAFVSGELYNTLKGGQNGGVVGSTWRGGRVDNVVSEMAVTGGNAIFGDSGYTNATVTNAFVTKPSSDSYATVITSEEANAKRASYNLTATTTDSSALITNNSYTVDYLALENAKAERKQAYENMERLIPFYNKELIVYYGNKIAETSKLYSTKIVDIVPMVDDKLVTDVYGNKEAINRLMVHYADESVEYINLGYKEDFKNNNVIEYTIDGTELIYAPEQFIASYESLINRLLPILNPIAFDSTEVREAVGVPTDDNGPYGRSLKYLFLKETFDELKTNLSKELRKVLSMDKSINTMGQGIEDAIVEKISKNKAEFLLGLSYLNRWYDVNFDKINTKELTAYKFDFFGDTSVSTLDVILNLGKSRYENLAAKQNDGTYTRQLAPYKKQKDVFSYLDSYRRLFLPDKTNNQWLKENSKAYIVESKSRLADVLALQEAADSKKDNKYSVGVYDKLSATNWNLKNMLLPLLTMKEENMYIISNLSTISFGGYERYAHENKAEDNILYMRRKVDQAAEWQRDHFDFWYKVLTPTSRDKLFRSVLNYDGFKYKNSPSSASWRGLDSEDSSIKEFFGPVGKYFRDNGSGAYANGFETSFVHDRILDQYGTSVYTHEMVHNSDGGIYFEGQGRREGQGAELFALGLLQNPNGLGMETFGINTMFTGDSESENRYHTANPVERFKDVADLDSYIKGMLDVVYVLEYAEAESILKLDDAQKKLWLRKMMNYAAGNHAGNAIKPLTDEEVARLTSLDALISNNIVTRRGYDNDREYGRNGYYTINLFTSNYAGLNNPDGAPGDVMFRRMAYELFAEKGYREGFLPYVSNYYKNQGLPMTDTTVLNEMFNGAYPSWNDFKKAMYQKRIDKLGTLKPITIRYELGKANTTKTITISSFEELQRLMNEAMAYDVQAGITYTQERSNRSWVHLLRQKVYNAYIRQTDDFRESIFS